ncbi:centromere-associated protein E isoform X2 [Nematostella vectensis]|uniref:centromere-associated protein E isoform X2 n=1 Tax=Nematostella vectensis TaxID=45351 RepID=UPI0020777FDB|nr:centromere-associated protein E isoform X2 [Nematostella vectensis]XP_048586015.1 centromere-associated protein E isoform X2 [Nematostella vectensis]XP_048586016.1 centromere-associated protein E isoform X2 [Nematostella vectensis]
MTKGKAGRIQVYVRVRPFTDKEKERKEPNAVQIHHDHSLIRVLDPRRETNYFFDGVFGPEASNHELYLKVGRPLVYAALNGYKGTLLTYGQTGTGKTYTLLSDDGVTTSVVGHAFERIRDDEIHSYKVTCSFLQVYQEKVYDLLNTRFTAELPVREHPKRGVYVANLLQNEVKKADDVLALLEFGKRQLVMADTKMVRHSSRSHSIMQLIIERRLKAHICIEKAAGVKGPTSPESVHESIMAVDETINNLLKELKQDRKSMHRRERECLKELMEKEMDDKHSFQGDVIVKGKINLCDLAGSERLTKTKAEGVRLTEAKYLNTSLLELGNVIHALARGNKRHVPYRNSTLTRLLQDCLGDNGKTNFIVCIAPSLSEVNETKCSLNFGLRAMRIINVARLNVEVDYKVLAERLAKKLEDQDRSHKLEKLEYLREIQRLNTAKTSYEENEHVVSGDTDTLVSVIQNLSKSVQREKEEKFSLQSELSCLKRQASISPTSNAPEIEALFLAELMSMQLLCHLHQSEAAWDALRHSDLPATVKDYMTSHSTQEGVLLSTGYMLQLIDTCLGFTDEDKDISMLSPTKAFQHDDSESSKKSQQGEPVSPKKQHSYMLGVTGGIRKMIGRLVGKEHKTLEHVEEETEEVQHTLQSTQPDKVRDQRPAPSGPHETSTKRLLAGLSHSKHKLEKQIANLLLSAFGEQLVVNQATSPQWGILGRKLSELIMFKRNNMIGISDEMWANYEDMASMLETCFKYILIDKALLASMVVIERMEKESKPQSTRVQVKVGSPKKEISRPVKQEEQNTQVQTKVEVSESKKADEQEIGKQSEAAVKDIEPLKENKSYLEREIGDVCDDTSRLETELFATMEEKTRLEDELGVMKDYVNRLKVEMFHLKIERGNLESEVRKTTTAILSLPDPGIHPDEQHSEENTPVEGHRKFGELSDVPEASQESVSVDSENGSHISDTAEAKESEYRNCLASMSKMYNILPNQDEDTLTEGEASDGKEDPSLSDQNIEDSDDDDIIIITKIAQEIRDYHSAANRSRSLSREVSSESGDSDSKSKRSKDSVIKKNIESKDLQVAYDDLEDELYNVGEELSKAQKIILELEAQLKEEKDNCEQVRKVYLEFKDKNYVLEGKVAILRDELEKALRENSFLKEYSRSDVLEMSMGQVRHQANVPGGAKGSKRFDLNRRQYTQTGQREAQLIKLLEENAELELKLKTEVQKRESLEQQAKEKEIKSSTLDLAVMEKQEEKRALQEEITLLQRQKALMDNELLGKKEVAAIVTTELELYVQETERLENELKLCTDIRAKLEYENKQLRMDFEKVEEEVEKWKQNNMKLTATRAREEQQRAKSTAMQRNLQMVFVDDDIMEDSDSEELKLLVDKLQHEVTTMTQYQETLEKDYTGIKDELTKVKQDLRMRDERIATLEKGTSTDPRSPSELKSPDNSQVKTGDSKQGLLSQSIEQLEDKIRELKQENSDLRQLLDKAEEKIRIYEIDLEKAMTKIASLKEEALSSIGENNEISSNIGTGDELESAIKAAQKLKEELIDKEAEKGLLYDELDCLQKRKAELEKSLEESKDKNRDLETKVEEARKTMRNEKSVKELADKNQSLTQKLKACEDALQGAKKKLQKEQEKMKAMEDDLVETSSIKLKTEFELRSAEGYLDKARSDLEQSESERKMLAAELKEKIERTANLEIQLMEFRCTNECIKNEIEQLREQKRQDSHQSNEINICKETLEKRLQEAFKENNQLLSEVQDQRGKNKELENKLQIAFESKEKADEELERLRKRAQQLEGELESAANEKKELEGKSKRLEDLKKKMEEDVWKLRSKINVLQSDLGKIEKQQQEAQKKSSSLEKEIKRKSKELDIKQRENRKLRKEMSSKDEKNTTQEGNTCDEVDVKRLKEKVVYLERQNSSLSIKVARAEAQGKRDESLKMDVDGGEEKRVKFKEPEKDLPILEQIGWDFENHTIVDASNESKKDEQNKSTEANHYENQLEFEKRQRVLEEVGWDFNADDVKTHEHTQEGKTIENSVDLQAGMAQVTKEKLILESQTSRLLESKTSYLTREQMKLQYALSKAHEENQRLIKRLEESNDSLETAKIRVTLSEEVAKARSDTRQMATQTEGISSSKKREEDTSSYLTLETIPEEANSKEANSSTPKLKNSEKAGTNSKSILVLTREKKQAMKELDTLRRQHEVVKNELSDKTAEIQRLEAESKMISSSHESEKDALLSEMKTVKEECAAVKSKLMELNEYQEHMDVLKQKNTEVEKLVTELENDLIRQTKEKNDLRNELLKSQNEVQRLKNIENELLAMRNENKQLAQVTEKMGSKLEEYKMHNKELQERLNKRKNSLQSKIKPPGAKKKTTDIIDKKSEPMSIRGGGGLRKDKKNQELVEEKTEQSSEQSAAQILTAEDADSDFTKRDGTSSPVICSDTEGRDQDNIQTVLEETVKGEQTDCATNVEKSVNENVEKLNEDCADDKGSQRKEEVKGGAYVDMTAAACDVKSDPVNCTEDVVERQVDACSKNESHDKNSGVVNSEYPSGARHKEEEIPEETNMNVRDKEEDKEWESVEERELEEKLGNILTKRQAMESEVHSMMNEMTHLRRKIEAERAENSTREESLQQLKEELEEVRMKGDADEAEKTALEEIVLNLKTEVEEVKCERDELKERVSGLKTQAACLEIELSDALEVKHHLEDEILRLREYSSELESAAKTSQTELTDKYDKLESVLSYVLEENTRLSKDMTNIREENKMLKDFSIKEVADGSTQMSPKAMEHELPKITDSRGAAIQIIVDKWDETPLINVSSPGYYHDEPSETPTRLPNQDDRPLSVGRGLQLSLQPGSISRYPSPSTPESKPLYTSSPDTQEQRREHVDVTPDRHDDTTSMVQGNEDFSTAVESGAKRNNTYEQAILCKKCERAPCECAQNNSASARPTATDVTNTETESFSADLYTDSSLASVTDLEDLSFTSDWMSSEDVPSGRRNPSPKTSRTITKMHRELADIKCTNSILENEVSILKNRNSDLQSQMQKLSGRNNSLKQKLCDKSLAVKKAEREVSSILEEKTRLEIRISSAKEEVAKLEKDRSKFERNLSNSKTENKRLKNELHAVKAENYKTMKALVSLEAENKKLQTDLDESREELRRTKELFMNGTHESFPTSHKSLSELPNWLAESHTPPTETSRMLSTSHDELGESKTRRATISYFGERVTSDQVLSKLRDDTTPNSKGQLSTDENIGNEGNSHSSIASEGATSPSKSSLSDMSRPLSQTSLVSETGHSSGHMSYDSEMSFPDRDTSSSDTSAESPVKDEKLQSSSIKKMFKKLSKTKKTKFSTT